MAETDVDDLETPYGPPPTVTPGQGGADINMSVVGMGEPIPRVRRASATIPSVDTAGSLLPPEAGPPSAPAPAPEDSGPLIDLWDPMAAELDATQKGFADNDAATRKLLQQLREDQEAATQRARAQLEYGYQRYSDAGQEVLDLAEQQRLRRPPLPRPPVEPPVPQQRIRLFGEGPEHESGMQALNRITMTLGVMAQMGMGMKSGYTRGAMAAFSGAMKGWAEGNQIAGNQQWREYLANVQKLDREWARNREHFNDILKTDAVDLDRVKTKMAIRQTELGYGKELVGLTFRDLDQRMKMFNVERDMLQDNMKNAMEVMRLRLMNDIAQRKELDLAKWRNEQAVRWEQDRLSQEKRAQEGVAARASEGALDRAAAERRLAAQIASREKIAAMPSKAAGGQKAQEMGVAANNAKMASDKIAAIMADPVKAAEVKKWLGGTLEGKGQKAIDFASSYTLGGAVKPPPQSVVDVSQYVAELRNELLNLKSGKQVTGIEETRLNNSLVTMDLRPEVFVRRIENMKPFIDEMLTWKDRGPSGATAGGGTPTGPGPAGGATQGGGVTTVIVKNAKGEIGHFNLQPGQKVPSGYEVVR